jgi:protocatechuate 3,4-dioxygenase beta subunit
MAFMLCCLNCNNEDNEMSDRKTLDRREIVKKLSLLSGVGLLTSNPAFASLVTPFQVKGPFYPIVEQDDTDLDLTRVSGNTKIAQGEVVLVAGQVSDSNGTPIANAVVDIWQANSGGRYSHEDDKNTAPLDPNFQGWGIVRTDSSGRYKFKTIVPGPYPLSFLQEIGMRCKHIHFKVTAEGARELITQMYFAGDPLIAQDLEIAKVAKDQRSLLIANSIVDQASGLLQYEFNITLENA